MTRLQTGGPAAATADRRADGDPTGGDARRPRTRHDIQGLRAIAVLLVLVHHAGWTHPTGGFVGVDVFFVIAGFLLTAALLRDIESTGSLSLLELYARRARRVLPAAALVLVATTAAAWVFLERGQWQQVAGDVTAAAGFVLNWPLAAASVDPHSLDGGSPVLHYWSLAVGAQFTLIWPLVIVGLLAVVRVRHRRAAQEPAARPVLRRRHLAVLLAFLVIPSVVASAVLTAQDSSAAFFSTHTRLWELGVGALVALGAGTWVAWRPALGAVLSWVGLLVVLVSAFVVDTGTPWPGLAALAPVLGTAAVLAGGLSAGSRGAGAVLSLRPLVAIGGLSYALYLWHWPLLRAYEWRFGATDVTEGLLIVAFSFVPAWLSLLLLESPFRHSRTMIQSPRYSLSMGFNVTVVAVLGGLVLLAGARAGAQDAPEQATGAGWAVEDPGPGAAPPDPPTLAQGDDEPFFDMVTPSPLEARADVPGLYGEGCHSEVDDDTVRVCERGDPAGEITVAVVGDSKIAQWEPALDALGSEHGWLVRVYTKGGCSFTAALTVADGQPNTSCRAWSEDVLNRLTGAERPDVVVTSGVRANALDDADDQTPDALVDGYVDYWTRLGDQGTRVVAVSDTPQPAVGMTAYECAAEHPNDVATACSWDSDDGVGSPALRAAAEQVDTADYIDMNPWVCPEGTCVAIYRNVLTYRQGSHITATFVDVLTEPLGAYLVPMVSSAETG